MGLTPQMIARKLEFERWRLRHELENVRRAQNVVALNHSQANADSALAALVRHGCDEAEELKRARNGI